MRRILWQRMIMISALSMMISIMACSQSQLATPQDAPNKASQGTTNAAQYTEPAEFIVNRVVIKPENARPSETIYIWAEIENVGGIPDNYRAYLFLDGVPSDFKDIKLDALEKQTIKYEIIVHTTGKHEVQIGTIKEYFTVKLNEIQEVLPSDLQKLPNQYVDLKITDFFYYTYSSTPNCQLYCNITNKHETWKMTNVKVRGVLLFPFINPGERDTIAKSIPCQNEGPLRYDEFTWEWSQ